MKQVSKYLDPEADFLARGGIAREEVQEMKYERAYDRGWSMRGLHINVRILGAELMAPTALKLVQVKGIGQEKLNDDVIIAEFEPTIAGSYTVDMRLVGFYPGVAGDQYIP